MLGKVWRWLEVGFALLALTLLTLVCHVIWPDKDGVAAWFQAIGSVAGIAIAIYVPWRQGRNAAEEDRRRYYSERAEGLKLLLILTDEIEGYLSPLSYRACPSPNGITVVPARAREVNKMMARLEAYQDRTHLDLCALFAYQLRRSLADILELCTQLDAFELPPGPEHGDPLGIHKAISDVRAVIGNVSSAYRENWGEVHGISWN